MRKGPLILLAALWFGACGSGKSGTGSGAVEDAGAGHDAEVAAEPDAGADTGALSDAAADAGADTGADAEVDSEIGVDAGRPAYCLGLPAPAEAGSPPAGFGRRGDQIVDSLGRAVVLHGVNASNHTKADPLRLTWHGPEDFKALARAGFNSIRLLVEWAAIMPAEGQVDSGHLDAVAQRVDWAQQAGLLVVLDMHQDIFGYGFGHNGAPRWACDEALYEAYEPQSPWWRNYLSPQVRACFEKLYGDAKTFGYLVATWEAVAARFKVHPAVVGFDLLNEPYWADTPVKDFVHEVWQPRQEELAAAIRAVAPDRVVFFEGSTLASVGQVDAFRPACDPRTAFAPHYYHPLVHEGTEYTPTFDAHFDLAFDAMSEMSDLLGGVPVWVGEFGVYPSLSSATAYVRAVVGRFAARRWSWAWWSDDRGGGFSLRDSDGAFHRNILEPLAHPYARRVPGTLLSQSMDFGTRGYEASFAWEIPAPLELWTGLQDVYPKGVDVRVESSEPGALAPACAPSPGAPEGVVLCVLPQSADGAGAEGAAPTYTIRIEPRSP